MDLRAGGRRQLGLVRHPADPLILRRAGLALRDDLLRLAVPNGSGGMSFMLMDRLGGRDQIVATAERASWSGFEPPLPSIFHGVVARSHGLVIDVGANTGFYSLLATCASTRARVLAFEPYQGVFETLARNIAANRAGKRIEALPIALSSRSGSTTLYIPTQEHGLMETSSSLERDFKAEHGEARTIQAVTLDDFLAGHALHHERVTLIKVDVEGHEAAVLAGARRTMARWRPVMVVEVLPQADTAAMSRFLASDNYTDVPLRPDAMLQAEPEIRHHADAWNHALVPSEGLAQFLPTTRRRWWQA